MVCAEAYQLAAVVLAPVTVLDNLSAAANGNPLPHLTFLPILDTDCARISELETALAAERERCAVAMGDRTLPPRIRDLSDGPGMSDARSKELDKVIWDAIDRSRR